MQHREETNEKVVIIGSCSVDFTTYASRLPKPGETIQGTKFTTSFGGKGANQCMAVAKLGANPYMICRVGSDQWGKNYKEYLKSNGVNVSYVNLTPNETTGIAQISVAENGENQIVIVSGANSKLHLADVELAKDLIINADLIIGQLETPFETTLEAFKLNKGIKLLNAAPINTDISRILPYCNILCINETEASLLSNLYVDSLSTAVGALKKLVQIGWETIIITMGENGAVYTTKDSNDCIHVLADKVKPVDTTGAGDAFVGALGKFLLSHKNYPFHQIIGAACHVASLSVTREGTQTSYPTQCDVFNKEYQYVVIK